MNRKYAVIGVALLIFGILPFGIARYRVLAPYSQAKENMLALIQQRIDENADGLSYKTDRYTIQGEVFSGEIYVINKTEDMAYIRDLLKKCQPFRQEHVHGTTNTKLIVGRDIDLRSASGVTGDYYWPGVDRQNQEIFYSFDLPSKYKDEIEQFCRSLAFVEKADN